MMELTVVSTMFGVVTAALGSERRGKVGLGAGELLDCRSSTYESRFGIISNRPMIWCRAQCR